MVPPGVMSLTVETRFRNTKQNEKILSQAVDTVDELRDLAKIRTETYQ